MDKEQELLEFKNEIKSLEECCLKHPADFKCDEIIELIVSSLPSTDSTEYAIFRLADGKFGVVIDWSDYTGHG